MKDLDEIRRQLAGRRFDLTRHALRRVVERNISIEDIAQAGAEAEVIENYPDDKYSPSALLLGFSGTGRPLHLQVSLSETETTRLITIYEPDPREWIANRIRK